MPLELDCSIISRDGEVLGVTFTTGAQYEAEEALVALYENFKKNQRVRVEFPPGRVRFLLKFSFYKGGPKQSYSVILGATEAQTKALATFFRRNKRSAKKIWNISSALLPAFALMRQGVDLRTLTGYSQETLARVVPT